jgi:hypothetical protein
MTEVGRTTIVQSSALGNLEDDFSVI